MKSLSFELRAVPPFRLDLTAWVLRRQPHNTVDRWDGTSWRRVLVIDDDPLEAAVTQIGTSEQPRLHVTLSGCRISEHAKQYASSLLRQMFGLGIDLSSDRVPPIPRSTLARRRLQPGSSHHYHFEVLFSTLIDLPKMNQTSLPKVHLSLGLANYAELRIRYVRGSSQRFRRVLHVVEAGRQVNAYGYQN
jgi:DNA-3-methyladenine glycosylase II